MPRRTIDIHFNDFRLRLAGWTQLVKRENVNDTIEKIKKFRTQLAKVQLVYDFLDNFLL